jgi:hypothetical protein
MEIGIDKLNLASATTPIPDFGQGADPYQGIQIHDYLQVSFLRQDPFVKAASKKTIDTLSAYYPETLSRKFFVSVPLVMQWMFTAMKLLLSKETVKKFTVMSYANQLVTELGPSVPTTYGGKAGELEEIGETVKFTSAEGAAKPEVTQPEVAQAETAKPEVAQPEPTKPEEAEPEAAKPEEAKPEVVQPDQAKPETTKP